MDEKQEVVERKPEEKETHLAPVVKGEVSIRKKSAERKFFENFFGGDFKAIRESVYEMAAPAIKDLFYGALDQMLRGFIYQDYYSRGSRRGSRDRDRDRERDVDYSRYSRNRDRDLDRGREDIYDYGELAFKTKQDATDVFDSLCDLLTRYKRASVGQLYELSRPRVRGTDLRIRHTDYNYGWRERDLQDICVTFSRGSYILKTPRPEALD